MKASYSKEIIKSVYDDAILPVNMKKDIFNHIVGKYNKIKNETFYTSMTTDFQEALDTKKNYGGRIIPIDYRVSQPLVDDIEEEDDDNVIKYYLNYITNSNELNECFRLLSLYIYDTAHKTLLNLKE